MERRCRPVLLLTLLALVAATGPAVAQRSVVIERFAAEIVTEPSGELMVTETLRPRFTGEWNGVRRILNLSHTTAAGEREVLEVDRVSATDEAGRPLRVDESANGRASRELSIWVPDAVDRTAEVVLRYRVRGAIRYFAGDTAGADSPGAADYDELYWQVTGTEWEVPILEASAHVLLPAGAVPTQAAAYRGTPDSGAQVDVRLESAAEGTSGGPAVPGARVPGSGGVLRPGEGLTVAVAWPAGYVAMPAGLERARPVRFGPDGSVIDSGAGPFGGASPWALLLLLLPFLTFWLTYRTWARRGRDPRERAITVRWDPPAGLGPAEAGTLVDNSPGMHDVISILIDLAVRGYVVIAEREKKGFLKFGKDYAFHLVRPRHDWESLAPYERSFLNGLFKAAPRSEVMANLAEEGTFLDEVLETFGGEAPSSSAPEGAIESVFLSDLQNRFYKDLPGIRQELLESLVRMGHYTQRPDKVRARWGALAAIVFALSFASVLAAAAGSPTAALMGAAWAASMVLSAVIIGAFALIMPARTEQGARTREAALGFSRFLERVESPRYRRMIESPDQFERYLPYAVAFDCADKWAAAFEDLVTEPPDWYRGSGRFRPTVFASDLGTLASTASSTLASSPSSSGSGGGGSVGGGSGGGGGGGF